MKEPAINRVDQEILHDEIESYIKMFLPDCYIRNLMFSQKLSYATQEKAIEAHYLDYMEIRDTTATKLLVTRHAGINETFGYITIPIDHPWYKLKTKEIPLNTFGDKFFTLTNETGKIKYLSFILNDEQKISVMEVIKQVIHMYNILKSVTK